MSIPIAKLRLGHTDFDTFLAEQQDQAESSEESEEDDAQGEDEVNVAAGGFGQ